MKLNLKYNATSVDEIEQARQLPIQNCMADTSVKMLALFIQKGLVNDEGKIGVSRNIALETIDNYLTEHDTNDLILDITEALVNGGFLSRELDVETMRKAKASQMAQAQEKLQEIVN